VEQPSDAAQLIRAKREEILRIAARHGAHNVRVFGSAARGEASPESEVGFLIDAGPVTSSWPSVTAAYRTALGKAADSADVDFIVNLLYIDEVRFGQA
jgi:predicted nucleotidyltransferase